MTDTDVKTDSPAPRHGQMKPVKIKYAVSRKNFLVKVAVVLMALSVLFRLIGYWGFWNTPDTDATYTQVFLPIVCCLLFIVLVELFGGAALWATSLPVLFTAVFLILETFSVTPWWMKALSILLYVAAACVYAITVFGKIRTKWLLVITIGTPLVYHLAVQDRTTLLNAASPATLVQWMPEISAMCFLSALLFTALSMDKIVPSVYDEGPDYIRQKLPKHIPLELKYGLRDAESETRVMPVVGEASFPKEEPVNLEEAPPETIRETRNAARRKMRKKKITYICLAAASLIAIVGVVFALVHSSNAKRYADYFNDGKQYFESGDYDSAVIYLEKAVSLKATDKSILMLADCYVAEDQTDKAIALLEKYSDKSSAVKEKLEILRNGDASGGDVTIGGEVFTADTTSVGLADKGLGSSDIKDLVKLTKLQSATLSGNKLTDISALSDLSKLEVLDLSNNSITDISPLSGLTSLRTLYLDNNTIKDFSPLYKLTQLTTLSIKGMDITEKQLKEIQDALPDCRIHSEQASEDVEDITIGGVTFKSNVTQLDLSGKGIMDISELSKCEDLEKLDLRNNSITDISSLMDIPGLKWLCLKNNTVSDLRPLMGLTRLTYLDVQNNKVTSISSVASMGSLQNLYLGGNSIGSFSPLYECVNLIELGLENTNLKDTDLTYLTNLTKLTKLYLENNTGLTQTGVDTLQKALKNCKISHSGLKSEVKLGTKSFAEDAQSVDASGMGLTNISAASGLTKCTTLILRNNSISDLSALSGLKAVQTLDLSSNSITDITALVAMTGLRSLDLEGNSITDVSPLLTMTWLKELYLSGGSLTQNQVDTLYAALPNCQITVEGYTP